jgi:hypothetical protein
MPENIDAHGFVTIVPDDPNTPAEPAEGTITADEPVEEKKQATPEKPKTSSRSKKAKTE